MSVQLELNYLGQSFGCPQTKEIDESSLWSRVKELLKCLPRENSELMPRLLWGSPYQLYTPAFWKLQYLMNAFEDSSNIHRISDDIFDEIVLCILGGYGIPSEMGMLAYERLKSRGLVDRNARHDQLLQALTEPFGLENGKSVRYRFSAQKANYIHSFLVRADLDQIPEQDDLLLREWLTTVKGIGPKTASWITRNWMRSERVAILDIHLLRAGVITGFFDPVYNIETEYYRLEAKYLTFCNLLEVKPSDMDAIIWSYMKKNNKLAINILSSIT